MNEIILYYFSGTGNAKNTAHLIADNARNSSINVNLQNIAELKKRTVEPAFNDAMIAFCGPTHGFNYPPILLHFIFRFPRGKNKVLLINTRAGMKVGKIPFPGLSGIALLLSALILFLKGYSITGMLSVDLPSNWLSLHPALRTNAIDFLYSKMAARITKFTNKIFSGKRSFNALYSFPIDLLISPIAVGYYFVGRFWIAKSFIASSKCTNCSKCVRDCPISAIKLIDNRPFWSYRCESCMHCMNNCPENAIETAHGFIVSVSWVLISLAMSGITYLTVQNIIPKQSIIYDEKFTISCILAFPILLFSYRINHYLLRYKTYNRFVNLFSLTSYKFWGRFKIKNQNWGKK